MSKYILCASFCSLFLNSFDCAYAGKVHIQLLVDDHEVTGRLSLKSIDSNHKITFPHISCLRIDDKDAFVKKNFKEFVAFIDSIFNKTELVTNKNQFTMMRFEGKKIERLEKSEKQFYVLSANEKSKETDKLIDLSAYLKDEVNNFMNKKSSADFMSQSPSSLQKDRSKQEISYSTPYSEAKETDSEVSKSYAEVVDYFPHLSLAKGAKGDPNFNYEHLKAASGSFFTYTAPIVGFNIIYSQTENENAPQLFVRKDNFLHENFTLCYDSKKSQKKSKLANNSQKSIHGDMKTIFEKVKNVVLFEEVKADNNTNDHKNSDTNAHKTKNIHNNKTNNIHNHCDNSTHYNGEMDTSCDNQTVYPNNFYQNVDPNGVYYDQNVDPNGFYYDQNVDPNGFYYEQTVYPNGFYQTVYPNGFYQTVYPNGFYQTVYPNGVYYDQNVDPNGFYNRQHYDYRNTNNYRNNFNN